MAYCRIDTIDFYRIFKKVLYIPAAWCIRCRSFFTNDVKVYRYIRPYYPVCAVMFERNHLLRFFIRLQFVSYIFFSIIFLYIFRCCNRHIYRILTNCILHNIANSVCTTL